MRRTVFIAAIALCISGAALGQQKPWSEWDKAAVDKMLNASPWGQTQNETDASQMIYQPTNNPDMPQGGRRTDRDASTLAEGAKNSAIDLKYRIRLFSARPVREAFARLVTLSKPGIKAEQLQNWVDGDYSEVIVVAVAVESTDRRYLGPVMQKLEVATAETLKNTAYLERADGKRMVIEDYAKPTSDGTGAKFVFPRLIEGGKQWLSPNETFRFVADLGGGTKISWKFKLSEMIYNGTLEY